MSHDSIARTLAPRFADPPPVPPALADNQGLVQMAAHVFPVAGLAVGDPLHPAPRISMRLPLSVTVHVDRFSEVGLHEAVAGYDAECTAQMHVSQTWSDGKLAQYERPQRTDFGVFIRGKGFGLG